VESENEKLVLVQNVLCLAVTKRIFMPVYYGIQTIFIHIPKCAGSGMAQKLFALNESGDGLSQEVDKHESAYAVANYLKYDLFLQFFKFGFVRNPYDRMVSWFHYYQKLWKNPDEEPCSQDCIDRFLEMDFDTWIKSLKRHEEGGCRSETACPFHFIANQYQYLIWRDGRIFVDFVGKVENIDEDWSYVCEKVGLPQEKLDVSNRSDREDYRTYYTEETKAIVTAQYEKDLEYFDYSF